MPHHLQHVHREARDTTFAPSSLLESYREGSLGKGVERREEGGWVRGEQGWGEAPRCEAAGEAEGCVCAVENCVHWFPCSLKYCRYGMVAIGMVCFGKVWWRLVW